MWGAWSAWSDCTVSCGGGTRIRSQQCEDPDDTDDITECTGIPLIDEEECNSESCGKLQLVAQVATFYKLQLSITLSVKIYPKFKKVNTLGFLLSTIAWNGLADKNDRIPLVFEQLYLYETQKLLNLNCKKMFQQCGVLGVCGVNVQYHVAAEHIHVNSYAKARMPRNALVSQKLRKKGAILRAVVSYKYCELKFKPGLSTLSFKIYPKFKRKNTLCSCYCICIYLHETFLPI